MTRGVVFARLRHLLTETYRATRVQGWQVSAHVSAYRTDPPARWCCVMRGHDGRALCYVQTLQDAAAVGAAVDAARPTYDRHGMVTAAARARIREAVAPWRPDLRRRSR